MKHALSSQAATADRALGALLGVAIGDALGMPGQSLTREDSVKRYGQITDFIAPYEGHPYSHGLVAACVTDDTEQTLLLADRLIASPESFDHKQWAQDLLDWEISVKQRGLHDLLGPSSKRALLSLLEGVPVELTGISGTTNGASMRIAPIGISTPVEPVNRFLDCVEEACRVTHNTGEAIAAAAAVAAVISAGIEGASFNQTLPIAIAVAREGASRGHANSAVSISELIERSIKLAGQQPTLEEFASKTGNSVASRESVPAAFGVVTLAQGNAWEAALLSANIGDDTDTIGAISTAMAASCSGAHTLPPDKVATVTRTNQLNLAPTIDALLSIRIKKTGASSLAFKEPD